MAAMLGTMLKRSREREGLSEHRTAALLGVSVSMYRRIESGQESPTWEVWDAICKRFGWPQTFTGTPRRRL
jgi:transcriptional regulator with XRE-family HTH domain